MLYEFQTSSNSWGGFLNLFCPVMQQTCFWEEKIDQIRKRLLLRAIPPGTNGGIAILQHPTLRTKETLAIMQEQVREFLDAEVHYISSFYSIAAMDGQTAQHLQHAICKLSKDEISTVMCMGHNRGWEEAASMFSGKLIELKTCNAALLEATGETWKEAFFLAGFGGWKLQAIVTPNSSLESL